LRKATTITRDLNCSDPNNQKPGKTKTNRPRIDSIDEQRKIRKAEQQRLATQRLRARKKNRNPVTKRLDPVSIFKLALPHSVYRHIDAAAIKKVADNPRDGDGKPISFEQARMLLLVDIVTAWARHGSSSFL
jgi:hypothetical protein